MPPSGYGVRMSAVSRVPIALAALVLLGCQRSDELGFTPADFDVATVLNGPADAGYGAALAVGADGVVRVGAPWGVGGGLFRAEELVLPSAPGEWLGAAIVGGSRVLVSAPGRGGGVVLREGGRLEVEGGPDDRLGSRLVQVDGELASITTYGVSGPAGWRVDEPLWSLTAVALGGRSMLVAGLRSGGVATAGGAIRAGGALGRGLTACALIDDDREELVVADPLVGRVQIHRVAADGTVDLAAPIVRHDLGPGAGASMLCIGHGLAVGAPDRVGGGGLAWFAEPLDPEATPLWIEGVAGVRAGHALAFGAETLFVGDPGAGRVVALTPRARR